MNEDTLTIISQTITDISSSSTTDELAYSRYLNNLIQDSQSAYQTAQTKAFGDDLNPLFRSTVLSHLLRFTVMNNWQPKEERKNVVKEIAISTVHLNCSDYSLEDLNQFAQRNLMK